MMEWSFQAANATKAVGARHEFLAFLRVMYAGVRL